MTLVLLEIQDLLDTLDLQDQQVLPELLVDQVHQDQWETLENPDQLASQVRVVYLEQLVPLDLLDQQDLLDQLELLEHLEQVDQQVQQDSQV